MKILVACEESQEVCKAFRTRGHEAYSCDILDCSGGHPEWHIKADVEEILKLKWDMIIAHPPCTYLSVSGLHWNKRRPDRAKKTETALNFVKIFFDHPCTKKVIENPVSCISSRIRKPDQIIQPYQLGHNASKKTCLWLFGVPPLTHTLYIEGRNIGGKLRWDNQTDSGQNKLGPSPERAAIRAKTYRGISNAMADQWG